MVTLFVVGSVFSGGMLVMTFPACFSCLLTSSSSKRHPPQAMGSPVPGSSNTPRRVREASAPSRTRTSSIRHHELESA